MYKTHVIKPNFVSKNSILKKNANLSPARHNYVQTNSNIDYLVDLIEESKASINVRNNKGRYSYVEIGDINTNTGGIDYKEVRSIDISSSSVNKLKKDDILISTVRTYLGGIGYVNKELQNLVATKALIVLRKTKKDFSRFYLFGVLRSRFFIEQVNLILNASVYPRMEKDNFSELKIPFPTKNNNPEPKKIENLISLITQNILDKEEQIKLKNQKIDELIEKELKDNQKVGTFEFRLPKISEIRNETRIDTGLYEKKYREIVYLIDDYKNSHFDLLEKYTAKRGQNLQITNIGLSIYSDVEKPNFYRLMTNIELTDQRTVSKFRWLGSGKKLTLIPKNTIFLSADGTVGRCMYITDLGKTITNIHPWIINRKKIGVNQIEDIFTAMFLGWLYKKGFYEKVKDKANGGGIKYNHLERYLKIPNFPESKQKEVAKEYYNPTEQSSDLNFENYLGKEKARNAETGIFQLNMELFSLREKLEDFVDKIVKEEKVNISFEY